MRIGFRPSVVRAFACLALLAAAVPARATEPVASVGETIQIYMDQARVLKLPDRTATLVVGNPLIADISVQQGGVLVVTGKGYGTTNLIALDRGGALLLEHPIEVQGPRDQVVVVYRGVDRETYSCTPKCERRITLGDAPGYFTANLQQAGGLNTQAQGGGAAAGGGGGGGGGGPSTAR